MIIDGENKTVVSFDIVNKSNQSVDVNSKYSASEGTLQFRREAYVLLSFLNYADKIGLKIPTSTYVRRRIHNCLSYLPKEKYRWPEPDFYEIISLAQHYGLPTRALDWSYDFKVALYFAVEDILENNNEDCILWAFNYKLFEDNYHPHTDVTPTNEIDEVIIYRPSYNNNSNLKGQKGLFTFLTSEINESNESYAFDNILVNGLIGRRHHEEYDKNRAYYDIGGFEKFDIGKNEKVFHKFIISGDLKARILNDLYKEGYAPENIYPSFQGVVDSIEKRVKLDNIINKEK